MYFPAHDGLDKDNLGLLAELAVEGKWGPCYHLPCLPDD